MLQFGPGPNTKGWARGGRTVDKVMGGGEEWTKYENVYACKRKLREKKSCTASGPENINALTF